MALSHDETKQFIDFVLNTDRKNAQEKLYQELTKANYTLPQFYDGVIEHGPFMNYTAEQWFDFHSKVPHWRLREESALMNKLSPHLRELLL
jgi:hypothetical protein